LEPSREDNRVAGALDDHLNERALGEEPDHDADPVWTWNAPSFLTGDDYRSDESKSSRAPRDVTPQDALLTEKMMAPITSAKPRRRLREKVANVRAFFGSKERFEKAKGGRTYREIQNPKASSASNQQEQKQTKNGCVSKPRTQTAVEDFQTCGLE
jgi:hypothetical protein